jgi:carbonic anhydrase
MRIVGWTALAAISLAAVGCKDGSAGATHVSAHAAPIEERPEVPKSEWTYAGERGSSRWGSLKHDFADCRSGRMQSPIDLVSASPRGRLAPIGFNYVPVPLMVRNEGPLLRALNSTRCTLLTGAGRHDRFALLHYELHTPSEHTIDGVAYDMEMELVHRNSEGKIAIVSLLFRAGDENPVLAPLLDNAPEERTTELLRVSGVVIDLPKLVPEGAAYFQYEGSLTTPPCTEGARWYVMEKILSASDEQIERVAELAGGPTQRPVEPLHGRQVIRFAP